MPSNDHSQQIISDETSSNLGQQTYMTQPNKNQNMMSRANSTMSTVSTISATTTNVSVPSSDNTNSAMYLQSLATGYSLFHTGPSAGPVVNQISLDNGIMYGGEKRRKLSHDDTGPVLVVSNAQTKDSQSNPTTPNKTTNSSIWNPMQFFLRSSNGSPKVTQKSSASQQPGSQNLAMAPTM